MIRRPTGPLAAVALVLALTVLVALASQGTPAWTLMRQGRADRLRIVAELAPLWGIGLLAAVAVALLLQRASPGTPGGAPPLRAALLRALPATIVVLVVLSLLSIARAELVPGTGTEEGGAPPLESDRPGELMGINDDRNPNTREGEATSEGPELGDVPETRGPLPPLILAALLAAVIAGILAWRWRTRAQAVEAPGDAEPDVARVRSAVDDTIDAMLGDPDPATAIIGAYARLLEGLAAAGAGRRPHEAPMEHLHRVLGAVRVRPGPTRALVELFAVARFSSHALTAAHRERALGALRDVAADLEGGTREPGDVAPRAAGGRR